MQRRAMLLLAAMLVAILAVGGVALARTVDGTRGDDRIRGTKGSDKLNGRGGDDVLLGLRGRDSMAGGSGRDAVLGGDEIGPLAGDRTLDGGSGGDFVGGGRGADSLAGGSGRDFMYTGPPNEKAKDIVAGQAGDDAVLARNRPAARDVIDCGGGFDRALVDSKDLTTGCEREFTRPGRFFRAISPDYFEPLP